MDVDLNACVRGDKRAWDAFVDRYAGVIHAAVRKAVGTQATQIARVDDMAQEVFVRLLKDDFRLLRTFDANRASLVTWLTLVSRSVAIDQLRMSRRPTAPLDDFDFVAKEQAPSAPAPQIPLHLLTHRQRVVLTLLFDDQRSVTETARILDIDEQTVRSTKHKGLSRLRQYFEDAEPKAQSRGDVSDDQTRIPPRRPRDDPTTG